MVALRGLNVESGEEAEAVIGSSGSGKSTLLKSPDYSQFLWDGFLDGEQTIRLTGPDLELRQKTVSFIFQTPIFFRT